MINLQTELYDQLQMHLEVKLPTYLEILRQMVGINSFTTNPDGVNALGKLTADLFQPLGFTAEMIPSVNAQYGRHLVMTRPGKSGRKIGLVSHLDTVFPPEEEVRHHFFWRQEGNRIYGPGTVDIKGGTVLIYMMLDALRVHAPYWFEDPTWVILLDASEETEAEDFGQLCRQRLEGEQTLACLIFEGGEFARNRFQVVTARKGMAIFRVWVEGKASHAGSAHEKGCNAIVQLAEVIQRLAAVTDYQQDVTVNVGVISGGTVTNRVPHHAEAHLEMRAFTPEAYHSAVAQIMALNEWSTVRSASDGYPCRVYVEMMRKTPPWPRNEATDTLLAIWQAAGESLGFRVLPEARGGLSDGNHLWHTIPSIDGLGVAGGNAHCSERSQDGHKDQEYCLISSFVPKALLNTAAVLRLLAGE